MGKPQRAVMAGAGKHDAHGALAMHFSQCAKKQINHRLAYLAESSIDSGKVLVSFLEDKYIVILKANISESELEKRKKFGYMDESTVPDSHCGNCSLFIPPDSGKACGGCLLFKGPVRPTGYCTQYAAKT